MNLGLTGGIATGKSTVVKMMITHAALDRHFGSGIASISADAIARDLLDPGTKLTNQVLAHFGPDFALDGATDIVDRRALAKRIFSDRVSRAWLENLLHPPIIAAIETESTAFRGRPVRSGESLALMVIEIPLLYEAGLEHLVDRVLVTKCSPETQVRRLTARQPNLSPEDALAQIHTQLSSDEKARRADYVLDTDQSLEGLQHDVAALFDTLLEWRS